MLLVKLAQTGNVIVSSQLAPFREHYESNGVPTFNVNRAETLASIDRVKKARGQSQSAGDHSA